MKAKILIDYKLGQMSKDTLRITFSYVGEKIDIERIEHVKMLSPLESPIKISKGQSGFWIEVHDEKDNLLFQKSEHNPIRFYTESYGDSIKDPISMHKIKSPKGVFQILVPDLENACYIIIFSSPFEDKNHLKPAVEIARFNIKKS